MNAAIRFRAALLLTPEARRRCPPLLGLCTRQRKSRRGVASAYPEAGKNDTEVGRVCPSGKTVSFVKTDEYVPGPVVRTTRAVSTSFDCEVAILLRLPRMH